MKAKQKMDNSIQAALKSLVENKATSEQFELLRNALTSGQIFIGGNVQNSVIIVGSGNTFQVDPNILELLAITDHQSALHQYRKHQQILLAAIKNW